eukprot:4943360-Pleurochrysis_carterae.AAC.3
MQRTSSTTSASQSSRVCAAVRTYSYLLGYQLIGVTSQLCLRRRRSHRTALHGSLEKEQQHRQKGYLPCMQTRSAVQYEGVHEASVLVYGTRQLTVTFFKETSGKHCMLRRPYVGMTQRRRQAK